MRFATLLVVLAAAAALAAPRVLAGTIAVVSCKNPVSSAAEPTEGWTATWTGSAFPYAGNVNECATGGNLASYVGDQTNQASSTGPAWEYTSPEGDAIVGGEIHAAFSIPGGANNLTGASAIAAPNLLFDQADIVGGDPGGVVGHFEGVYSLAGHGGGHIWMYAFCEPPNSTCFAGESNNWYWALGEIRWADLELSNSATPTASGFSGGVATSTSAMSGTQTLALTAHDEGAGATGVYLVKATLDGQTVYNATPNTNGGACVALTAHRFAGVYEFASAHPCKASESVSIPINTAAVKDGSHELVVSVIDAAGNESVVYTREITTNNAPTVISEPSVSGSAQVGATLTATPASFAAPEGAGSLSAIDGQWLRCSDAAATHCAAISGATASTYSPNSTDVGYYMVYASSASDRDGTSTVDSQPTVPVTEPAKEVAGFGGQSNPSGQAGGAGSGGTGGTGGAGGSSGGLTVNLSSQHSGLLGNKEPWRISLRASKNIVKRGKTVAFEGAVSSSPRPGGGKLVYLRARAVVRKGKRTIYGKWITFAVTYTNSQGHYKIAHKFKLTGTHLYQFQATAPKEAGFANSTGVSRMVRVQERPRGRR